MISAAKLLTAFTIFSSSAFILSTMILSAFGTSRFYRVSTYRCCESECGGFCGCKCKKCTGCSSCSA